MSFLVRDLIKEIIGNSEAPARINNQPTPQPQPQPPQQQQQQQHLDFASSIQLILAQMAAAGQVKQQPQQQQQQQQQTHLQTSPTHSATCSASSHNSATCSLVHKKPRRRRTAFTQGQLAMLEKRFTCQKYLSVADR